ncbi:MAG: squalene/phytoene synthase family protein [Hyphomicrobium sp.]
MPTGSMSNAASDQAFILGNARLHEPDRYIAALLSPANVRDDLITIAAYLGEVRRIPLSVSDATLGEIRLQWWRDVLEAGAEGGLSGNPIADEMVRVMARHDLPLRLVLAPLDAACTELGGEPFGDEEDWSAYLGHAEGAGMQLAALCIGEQVSANGEQVLEVSGRAYAAVRMALRLPELIAKARWSVPKSIASKGDPRHVTRGEARAIISRANDVLVEQAIRDLGRARKALTFAHAGTLAAILQVALVRPYAKAILRGSRDSLLEPPQIAPLTRISRLWWASKMSRI